MRARGDQAVRAADWSGRLARSRRDGGRPHGGEPLELLGEGAAAADQHGARGDASSGIARLVGDQVAAQDEDAARPTCAAAACGLACSAAVVERLLEVLDVGRGALVEDDEVDGEPLQPRDIRGRGCSWRASSSVVDDRRCGPARSAGRRRCRAPRARCWPAARRGLVGGAGAARRRARSGKPLEQAGVVGVRSDVAELDLRVRPGERRGALEGERRRCMVDERAPAPPRGSMPTSVQNDESRRLARRDANACAGG